MIFLDLLRLTDLRCKSLLENERTKWKQWFKLLNYKKIAGMFKLETEDVVGELGVEQRMTEAGNARSS